MNNIYSLFFEHSYKRDFGDSCGNRTRVAGVRGRSLNRLTNEPFFKGLIVVSPLLLVHHQGLEPGTP